MELNKEFFDKEIEQLEKSVVAAREQMIFVKGGLAVLDQLRALLEEESAEKQTVTE